MYKKTEDKWDQIYDLILKGYQETEKNNYDDMAESWLAAWEQVKIMVAGAYRQPSIRDVEEATEYVYGIEGWLQDMEMELGNAHAYEQKIQFCREVLEIFACEEEESDCFMVGIGEALHLLNQTAECDEWYLDWLKKKPENAHCISSYVWCLMESGRMEQAKEVLDRVISPETECNMENMEIFYRAVYFYGFLKDAENEKIYKEKLDVFHKSFQENPLKYPFNMQEPVIKEKKIYPNEKCPCGSGKKYKKCCGK